MLSHNVIKFINSLKIKKYRQQHQAFLVEGEKSVAELLKGRFRVSAIYCLEGWMRENYSILQRCNADISIVTEEELHKISDLATPNKVLAVAGLPVSRELDKAYFNDLILALDGIRDPGNMGTILRTADWFGIKLVVCSPDCVDAFNPKVIQSSMGSYARIHVHYMELVGLIKAAPHDFPVFGALLEGPSVTEKKFTKPGILIIGNESKGISKSLIRHITDPVFIPPFHNLADGTSHAESLNASVANAIICYEIRKQLSENKF